MQAIERVVISDGVVIWEGFRIPAGVYHARVEPVALLSCDKVLSRLRLIEVDANAWSVSGPPECLVV